MEFYPLNDLCIDVIDCPHSTPQWLDEGITVIRNFNLNNGYLDFSKPSFVDEKTYKKRVKRAVPEAGDIVISREAPMGVVAIIPDGLKCCLGQRLVLLKVDRSKCSPEYLLYALMSEYVQRQIKKVDKTGSIVSNLNIPDLKKLEIPVIGKGQKEIAELLTNIDRMILINRDIQKDLQGIIEKNFNQWFFQYDFPNKDNKPYSISGGEMTYYDEIDKWIPKEFENKKISDFIKISNKKVNPCDTPEKIFLHYSIPQYDKSGSYIEEEGKNIQSEKFIVNDKQILVSKLNPWFNRVVLPVDDKNVIASTEFVVWEVENDFVRNFLYAIAIHPHFIKYCTQKATGTSNSHKRIKPESMVKYSFWANEEIIMQFGKLISPYIAEIKEAIAENRDLIQMKEFLMPLLMNEQIKFV